MPLPSASRSPWHSQPSDEVFSALTSSTDGLTSPEAAARAARYGPNLLPQAKGDGPLVIFWRQIYNPLIYALLVASASPSASARPSTPPWWWPWC